MLNPAPTTPAIRTAGVDVVLHGNPIVRNADLSIETGRTVAILGNNGSGKTTLLRAVLGLVPHRGTIELFGTPLAEFRDWRRIGYVPQRGGGNVQQATAREVVASGRLATRRPFLPETAADRAAITAALTEVGLAERARYPFVRLSGGQQQRVLIARAIASGADLMLWDEPLAGVDYATQDLLAGVAARFKADGRTVVMVLHELGPFAGLIDDTVTLADGRVLAPEEAALARSGHAHGHHGQDSGHDPHRGHDGHEVDELPHRHTHHTGLEAN